MRGLYLLLSFCLVSAAGSNALAGGTKIDVHAAGFFSEMISRSAVQYEQLLAAAEREQSAARPFPKRFQNGKRAYVAASDWCSGFFPGSLWFLYEGTGDAKWRAAAERWTKKLEKIRHYNGNHDIGFMLMTSYGNQLRLTGDRSCEPILRDGAAALVTRYRAQADVIQSWPIWRGDWRCPVIID